MGKNRDFSKFPNAISVLDNGDISIPNGVFDIQKNQNGTSNFYIRNTNTTDSNSRNYVNIVSGNVTLQLKAIHGDNVYMTPTTAVNQYLGYNNYFVIKSAGEIELRTSTYNRITSYFTGSYTSGFKFSDLYGGIIYDAGVDTMTFTSFRTFIFTTNNGTQRGKITNSGSLIMNGHIYSTYTQTLATPNGGSQSCRIIEDNLGKWILVGRFAANAAISISSTWSSVRGLSTSTSQSETTAFSADWGESLPTEVRVMGATDFDNWKDTRTIDFVYRVPAGRTWASFFNNGGADGTYQNTRFGFTVNGCYDGFGRWNNPSCNMIGMSDGAYTNPSTAYTTPTSNAFNWNTTQDAKLTAIHTGAYSGQDFNETTGFGLDDNIRGFFDSYPTLSSNMNTGDVYSSSVWVLIKLN